MSYGANVKKHKTLKDNHCFEGKITWLRNKTSNIHWGMTAMGSYTNNRKLHVYVTAGWLFLTTLVVVLHWYLSKSIFYSIKYYITITIIIITYDDIKSNVIYEISNSNSVIILNTSLTNTLILYVEWVLF